jgi:hypothetical protein
MNLFEAEELYSKLEEIRQSMEMHNELCVHTNKDEEEVEEVNKKCLELAHKIRIAKESINIEINF